MSVENHKIWGGPAECTGAVGGDMRGSEICKIALRIKNLRIWLLLSVRPSDRPRQKDILFRADLAKRTFYFVPTSPKGHCIAFCKIGMYSDLTQRGSTGDGQYTYIYSVL